MTKVGLAFGHAASNYGDIAINEGVQAMCAASDDLDLHRVAVLRLRDAYSDALFDSLRDGSAGVRVIITDDDADAEAALLARYLREPSAFLSDAGFDDVDLVALNSGEHLFEAENGANTLDLIWRVLPAIAAAEAGLAAVQMPATVGPFRTAFGTQIIETLRAATQLSTREDNSFDYLVDSFGAEPARLLDPAFFCDASGEGEPTRTGNEFPARVGLVLRLENFGLRAGKQRSAQISARMRTSGHRDSKAFGAFRDIARRLAERGTQITLIVQTMADRGLTQNLHDDLAEQFPDQIRVADPGSLHGFRRVLGEQELVIASRFHACILAIAEGVPAIGTYTPSHGPKMPGMYRSLGFPEGAVIIGDRIAESVGEEVLAVLPAAMDGFARVQGRVQELKADAVGWLDRPETRRPRGAGPLADDRLALMHELLRFSAARSDDDRDQKLRSMQRRVRTLEDRVDVLQALAGSPAQSSPAGSAPSAD